MKNTKLSLLLIALAAVFAISCKKSDKTDDNNNNNNKIPDAVFSMEVTGAESHTFNFTLEQGTAGDYAIIGSHLASQQLMSVGASTLPLSWQFTLFADMNSMASGTYVLKDGISGFVNPNQTVVYLAVSGSVTITKANSYMGLGWYIDGTFTGTFEDNSTPPNQVNISGSFSGVYVAKG